MISSSLNSTKLKEDLIEFSSDRSLSWEFRMIVECLLESYRQHGKTKQNIIRVVKNREIF
jgi:hypothetical protein